MGQGMVSFTQLTPDAKRTVRATYKRENPDKPGATPKTDAEIDAAITAAGTQYHEDGTPAT